MRWRILSIERMGCLVAMLAGAFAAVAQTGPGSPRELLESYGIDASQLARFHDGEPLGGSDEETLVRILLQIGRFPRHNVERWSQPAQTAWPAIVAQPGEQRGVFCRLAGRAIQVDRAPLLPEIAKRLEFSEYYRVTLRLDDPGRLAIVCTRNVPQAWLAGKPIDERAETLGLFLKVGERTGDATELVFAADRVGWHPDRKNPDLAVQAGQVFLGNRGFDVGLLDLARAESKKPLSLAESECFYQLLAAVVRSDRAEFIAQSQRPLPLAQLLRDPDAHQGQMCVLEGIARQAIKVRVDDAQLRARIGIDHYYQLDLFVDLNNQVVKLSSKKSGTDGPVFENSFPVTVCVPSLPDNLAESATLRENVRVHAVFYRLWSFPSEYVSSFDKDMQQAAPMFFGVEPRVVGPVNFNPGLGIGLVALLVVSLVGIWVGVRSQGNRSVVSRVKGPSAHADQSPDRPDFSNLK